MRRDLLLLLSAALALIAVAWANGAPPLVPVSEKPAAGYVVDGAVVGVVDGDTLDFEIRQVIRVRLLNCWAPESRTLDIVEKAKGLAAKANLKRMADGKAGRLYVPTTGRLMDSLTLERAIGQVWLTGDSIDLSTLQVHQGYATREKE